LRPENKRKEDAKKSTVKFPLIEEEKRKPDPKDPSKEEEKDPKKKPKPDMVDAWTQTERSDYSIIKSRMLSH
jgi:hypothetical protein